jgi:pimeloyl-ACP methyl ester carboxylesterase
MNTRVTGRCVLVLALSPLVVPTDRAQAQEGRKAGEVVIEPGSVTAADVGKVDFDLGTVYVPENRAEPKGRLIGVGFARFRAAGPTDAPPIFLLPGGPGSSFLTDLKQGNPRLPGLLRETARLRQVADVVLVDQRGFSPRGDVLRYAFRTPEEPLDQPGSLARRTAAFGDMAKAAVTEFAKKGIDLRGYTVIECADDVRDLAKALKYPRVTLMGGSFGSQWSFAIMRRHPDLVARALLAGVEPLDCGYDMPSHVLAAVRRMWWEAEQDLRLKPYLPPGGLWAAARDVLRRLERTPVKVTLKGAKDAKTGEAVTVTLGHEDFQREAFLRGADGPAFVLNAYHERYDAWASATAFARRGRPAEVPLITPLIDTSLGVTPKRRYLLQTDPANEFLGQWNFASYLATADVWPTADVGDDFRTETVTHIPVVFVNGDWDTQTPVENALGVAPYFPNGRVLIVERGGHGAMGQLSRHHPETMDALTAFLKTGGMEKLPTRVSVPGPKWSVPGFEVPK